MKKIKLNLDNIQGAELLSREQLKKVVGGFFGTGNGCNNPSSYCYSDAECCTTRDEKCVEGNCRPYLGIPCGDGDPCEAGQHCVWLLDPNYEITNPEDPNDTAPYTPQCV